MTARPQQGRGFFDGCAGIGEVGKDLYHGDEVETFLSLEGFEGQVPHIEAGDFPTVTGHGCIGFQTCSFPTAIAETLEEKTRSTSDVQQTTGRSIFLDDLSISPALIPQQASFSQVIRIARAAAFEITIVIGACDMGIRGNEVAETMTTVMAIQDGEAGFAENRF